MDKGFTVVELLIVIIIIAIISVIALPQFINAQDRGKQSQTVGNLRSIGNAMALYHTDNNTYPVTTAIETLKTTLEEGGYMSSVPTTDGWDQTLQVTSTATAYTIWSCGKSNGNTCVVEASPKGVISIFTDQIILKDGAFVQYPAGAQN
ncbi:MAG: type II secretion system protein GspG [Legionellales bacterium]|nr:type II secretion system protein GspG [Legionellales bacterium]